MHRDSYWRTGAVFRSALGAVEGALLDIKGKALGVPVYELLGGKHRDRVRCYANHWFFGARTPDDYAEKARRAVEMGFRALKWDPFDTAWLEMDRPARRRTIEIVEAVRAAVGPDVELMLDVHGRLNVPTAIAMARELARFDLTWIEEPVPPEAIDALAEVRAASPVPIAAGERLFEPERFLELIQKRAADILQPDVVHVGGPSALKAVAAMAHARMLPVAPHNPTGPVTNAMTLHTALAIPNFSVFETVIDRRALAQGARPRDPRLRGRPANWRRPRRASAWSSTRRISKSTPTNQPTCRSSTARSMSQAWRKGMPW